MIEETIYFDARNDARAAVEIAQQAGSCTLTSGASIGLTPGDVLAHLAKLRGERRMERRDVSLNDIVHSLMERLVPERQEGLRAVVEPSGRRADDKPHPDDLVRRGDVAEAIRAQSANGIALVEIADSLPCYLPGFDAIDPTVPLSEGSCRDGSFRGAREVPAAEAAPTTQPTGNAAPTIAPAPDPVPNGDQRGMNEMLDKLGRLAGGGGPAV